MWHCVVQSLFFETNLAVCASYSVYNRIEAVCAIESVCKMSVAVAMH